MQEFNENDIIEEELEEDGLITLQTADGEEIEFHEIAGIALNSGFYAILQPVILLKDMAEDEALVFRVDKNENGDDKFTYVIDNDIIDAVFEKYYIMLEAFEKEDNNQ